MATDAAGDLGLKIMLDCYVVQDMTRRSLVARDIVIACIDTQTGQREVGTVEHINDESHQLPLTQLDKPLETSTQEIRARVVRGITAVEVPAGARGVAVAIRVAARSVAVCPRPVHLSAAGHPPKPDLPPLLCGALAPRLSSRHRRERWRRRWRSCPVAAGSLRR